MRSDVFVILFIGFVAQRDVRAEGFGREALSNRSDISSHARSIIGLLLDSLPAIKEHSDETKLGPQHVLISRKYDLLMLNTSESVYANQIVNITKGESVIMMPEYDPVDDFVYWSTNVGVYRSPMNNSFVGERKEIYFGRGMVGLALDWVSRNLYMADEENNRIVVSRLDGRFMKTLVEEGIDGPRGIGVDPETGRVFWSEWKSNPRIASAALDGSDVQTLVNDNLKWPNGLAVDCYRKLVYFGDARYDKIEVVGMDGSGRRTFTDQGVEHIFGLSYLGGNLYFTDWRQNVAIQIPVNDPNKRTTILRGTILGIKATYLDPIGLSKNPCSMDNGGCSHLCLFTGKAVACECPDVIAQSNTTTAPCTAYKKNL